MIGLGLSSSAFPLLGAKELAFLARGCAVEGIEWSDCHVPRNDPENAAAVMIETLRAGLTVVAYRSAFRFSPDDDGRFDSALEIAKILNAPQILVWAPRRKSLRMTDENVASFVDEARAAGEKSRKSGVNVCFELDPASWFDGYASAADLLARIDHPFVRLCWTPFAGDPFDTAIEGLCAARGRVSLVRARAWDRRMGRHRIERFGDDWMYYMEEYHKQAGDPEMQHFVLIHSVRGDSFEALGSDAKAMQGWIRGLAWLRGERRRS